MSTNHKNALELAVAWAKNLMTQRNWLLLDTETTGLHWGAEVVQVAVISPNGTVLLDSLVKPLTQIESSATAVHGITAEAVATAPTFPEIYPALREILKPELLLVSYNADFDRRMLRQSCEKHNLPGFESLWQCAMEMYAQFYGEWNSYHKNYKWQPLPGGDHTALGDCRAALQTIKSMAESK
jgi:DNA polymerase III subunit epsilon